MALLVRLLVLVFGSICAWIVVTYGWIAALSYRHGGAAVDIMLVLHSPLYWLVVVAILAVAALLFRGWVF
ncbi:MAG TPA: hypothetical protein VFO46_08655 [Candidatus Sulfotelmatobacter sp.]|nr:hypothetical protein [Candidatus Sulfotelmatobacter sp.]